jgi:protein gp37
MGETSGVSWATSSFGFWIGCSRYTDPSTGKMSRECEHCYMFRDRRRFGQDPEHITRTSEEHWRKPLVWERKQAKIFAAGHCEADRFRVVFANPWADYFGAGGDDWRDDAWALIRETPHLLWLLLTKRTKRMAEHLPADWGAGYPNVYLGATVGHPDYLHRVDDLCAVPAVGHFLSLGPLLGHVSLCGLPASTRRLLTMVIVEGETGPGARPTDPDWARMIRTECREFGIYFHFKSWGAHVPAGQAEHDTLDGVRYQDPMPFPVAPLPQRTDTAGRDVTHLPGLWDESDLVQRKEEVYP